MAQKATAKKKPVRAPLKVVETAPVPVPVAPPAPEPHFTKFTHQEKKSYEVQEILFSV
jgi:hypothetical protein